MIRRQKAGALAAALLFATPALADGHDETAPDNGSIEEDGTVVVPSFELPPSIYLSDEAKARLPREPVDMMAPLDQAIASGRAAEMRAMIPQAMKPQIDGLKAAYKVRAEAGETAGVPSITFTPEDGVPEGNRDKVLINLPGGGFILGHAGGTGSVESIPLAGMARVKIISLTYRQAPEHHFPAASEDVAAVYRELLNDHAPEDIGIFGCSAGGTLTAQSVAWFIDKDLPVPGAIGIFCASADAYYRGDSEYYNRPFQALPPRERNRPYYAGADVDDPLASPIRSPEILAQFPPTLLISGTRAPELSAAVTTHKELVKAGAEARLHLWDGLGHGAFLDTRLPESREAFDVMVGFFGKYLKLSE